MGEEKSVTFPVRNLEPERQLSWKFPRSAGGYTLIGRSWACEATSFFIPELEINLDAGVLVSATIPRDVFITHTHTDHCQMMNRMKSRRKAANIYMPAAVEHLVKTHLDSCIALSLQSEENPDDPWMISYYLKPVTNGDVMTFTRGGQTYVVDVIDCHHSVACNGYLFSRMTAKLKPEYQSLPGKEIGKLRKSGVSVTSDVKIPLFAYLLDTTHQVFVDNPEVFNYSVLVVECTFLLEDDKENGQKTKHMHWDDLKPFVMQNQDCTFVLTHFSRRYSHKNVCEFFSAEKMTNVVVWCDSAVEDEDKILRI